VTHWDLPEASPTRAVDVPPVLSLERVREPGDVLAVPVVIADLAVLAQVFLAECALNLLEILHCLVALSFCMAVLSGSCSVGSHLLLRESFEQALQLRGQADLIPPC
jgi:hypothetical protein